MSAALATALEIEPLEFLIAFTPKQRATLAAYYDRHEIVGIPTLVRGEVAFQWRHANDTLGWTIHSRIRADGVAIFDT